VARNSTAVACQAWIIAYAKVLGSPEAVLVYPQDLTKPFDSVVGGDIHVWTTTFGFSGDLEDQGRTFLAKLLEQVLPCRAVL
jgi:hypothetical protein